MGFGNDIALYERILVKIAGLETSLHSEPYLTWIYLFGASILVMISQ